MTPWVDLPEHDKIMVTAAKNKANVIVARSRGPVRGKLIAWMPRGNRPLARVQFGTGTHASVPHSAITLLDPPPVPVKPAQWRDS